MQLSLPDISKYIGVAENTILRWVRQGKIPVKQKGNLFIFQRSALEKWASRHNITLASDKKQADEAPKATLPTLSEAIENGGIYYNITGNTVEDVLSSALENIQSIPSELKSELFEKLIEREKVLSTGVGNGIAIPHPRMQPDKLSQSMLAICFLEKPIDYKAMDHKPVSVLFILLCPSLEIHLHILSTLSFCLRNIEFSNFIKSVPDQQTILEQVEIFQKQMAE